MQFIPYFLAIGMVWPALVMGYLSTDSPTNNNVAVGESDDVNTGADQSGLYGRVLHRFYRPYLKASDGTTEPAVVAVDDDVNRRKRDGNANNYRKPLLFKRQTNARKPILFLDDDEEDIGSTDRVVRSDREVIGGDAEHRILELTKQSATISRSIPFPEDNGSDREDTDTSDGHLKDRLVRKFRHISFRP